MQAGKAKLTFYGGTGEVTGANFLLEIDHDTKPIRVLVDCGLFQGSRMSDDKNQEPFPYDPSTIDFVFITHAHLDHIGRLPKLVRDGFKGRIISTPPTKDISELMFIDSLGVFRREAKKSKQPLLYEEKDAEATMKLWETVTYDKEVVLGHNVTAHLTLTGHTLGSSMVHFKRGDRKIVFTGDLGNTPAPLLRSPMPVNDAQYMVVESVYGDRNHEGRDERRKVLQNIIETTMKRGGVLMIPAFSLERTQELLYEIERMMENGKIPLVPVYIDSPLAIKITKIYKKYSTWFNEGVKYIINSGNEIFHFPQLQFTLKTEESKAIANVPAPKIIIAGSGMSNGGRILHHEKRYLDDPKSTLLMAGYQAINTLGRRLQEGVNSINIMGQEVNVRAQIETLRGYSGHMDSEGIVEFVGVGAEKLEKVFVTMGEPGASMFLAQRIKDFHGTETQVPEQAESVEIVL